MMMYVFYLIYVKFLLNSLLLLNFDWTITMEFSHAGDIIEDKNYREKRYADRGALSVDC